MMSTVEEIVEAAKRLKPAELLSLRQKLESEPRQPRFFLTVQRLGYKFKP